LQGFPFGDVLRIILESQIAMFRYPSSMIWFWVVMSIVYFQYRRMSALEVRLFGQSRRSAIVRTVFSLGEGILGGTLGSFLIILLGASAERLGLGIVWLAALALATIDIRFICFSYAGGIVSLLNLALGWPDVDVISIMAFVGVLHLVESALILLSGHHDATPTLVTGPDNRPAGGFYMGKYWPVPITVLWIIYTLSSVGAAEGGIAMPDWWPLLKGAAPPAADMRADYWVLPITVAMGYGDATYTRLPRQKTRFTAGLSALFSIVLLGLTLLAGRYSWLKWAAALFSPIGHELVIHMAQKAELDGVPLMSAPERGVRVLDVGPGSPCDKAGIKPGDIIEAVNCQPVSSIQDFAEALRLVPYATIVDVRSGLPGDEGGRRTVQIRGVSNNLGLILVPTEGDYPRIDSGRAGLISIIMDRIRRRRNRRRR